MAATTPTAAGGVDTRAEGDALGGGALGTPVGASTVGPRRLILSNEAITAATDAIAHVVEAAAEQVYLNAVDRLYVPGYAATRAFDDVMHVINWQFLNRPKLAPATAQAPGAPAAPAAPAAPSKPSAGGGAWGQEPEPVPCDTDTLTSWRVPTRKPPPPPPPEPKVEVNPYGRSRRRSGARRRRRSRSNRSRRGSQASRRSSIGSTASGRRTPASVRGSTPVHMRHTSGMVGGTAVAFDAFSLEAQFATDALNVQPVGGASNGAAPAGAKATDGSQYRDQVPGFSLSRPDTANMAALATPTVGPYAGITPIVGRDGQHKGLFDTSGRLDALSRAAGGDDEGERRKEFEAHLRKLRAEAKVRRARQEAEEAEAAQMEKRRKALSGKTVTVDSTVEGGMVFQEPLPKVVLVREPLMRVEGRRVEDMESFDPHASQASFDETVFLRQSMQQSQQGSGGKKKRGKARRGGRRGKHPKPDPVFKLSDMQTFRVDTTSRAAMFPSTVEGPTSIGRGATAASPHRRTRRGSNTVTQQGTGNNSGGGHTQAATRASQAATAAARAPPQQPASPPRVPPHVRAQGHGRSRSPPNHRARGGAKERRGRHAAGDGDGSEPATPQRRRRAARDVHASPKPRHKPSAKSLQQTLGVTRKHRDRRIGRAIVSPIAASLTRSRSGAQLSGTGPGGSTLTSLPSMQSVSSALNGTGGSAGVAGGGDLGASASADGVDIMDVKRRRHQSFAAANYMRNHLPAYMAPVPSPIKQAGASIVRGSSQRSNLNHTFPGAAAAGNDGLGLGMSAESLSTSFRVPTNSPGDGGSGRRRGHGGEGRRGHGGDRYRSCDGLRGAVDADGSRVLPHAPNAMQLLFGNGGRPASSASGVGHAAAVDTSYHHRARSPASAARPVTPLNLAASANR